jgi:serine phosphatase RsbU (regulator of sigma subunit)
MPFNVVAIISSVFYITIIFIAAMRRHQDSRIFLIGFIILFLAFINDYLHNSFIIQTLNTIDAGLFLFIFTQAYTLSRRFTRAFNDIEFMSMELRDLNINQEKIIEQRTGELLEKQRQIERQLQLARSIQQSLIPDVSGSMQNVRMKAVYLPLDEVGGDFYDVIRIDDTRIGIFLADVSGHGVPAAMIASMVKSFINLHAHSGYGCEQFLLSLNSLLFPMIHSYFVTCFYGMLSAQTRTMEFCLAGHPPPVLVHVNGGPEMLSAKGTAIGFRANPVLETRSVKFSAGERIYLYSDGVTEAFSPEGEMFGTERLTGLMVEHRTQEIGDALNTIITKVREFQNKESFNDDLTLLVIESI